MINRLFPVALLLLSGLAGCADGRSGYPSLAPRPVERAALRAQPVPAEAQIEAATIPGSADIAQLLTSAQAADAAFKAALETARTAIEAGRGAAEGSEAWVDGQQAYSRAEAERAPVGNALAELDRRRQTAVAAGNNDEEAAIAEASLQVQALHEAETALLEALLPSQPE